MLENNMQRTGMTIIGIFVLAGLFGFLFVSGENVNSNAKEGIAFDEQTTQRIIEESENRTPKY